MPCVNCWSRCSWNRPKPARSIGLRSRFREMGILPEVSNHLPQGKVVYIKSTQESTSNSTGSASRHTTTIITSSPTVNEPPALRASGLAPDAEAEDKVNRIVDDFIKKYKK